MTTTPTLSEIVSEFSCLTAWEDRYSKLIALAKNLDPYPEEYRTDEFLVSGCQSQVWLHPRLYEGRMYFTADSDAIIVRGIVALIVIAYSGRTPAEVLADDAGFLMEMGLSDHLSPSRTNGILAMIRQIKLYARAYAAVLAKETK